MMRTISGSFAIAMLLSLGASVGAQDNAVFAADGYQPAHVLPFSLYGKPVGYAATMTVQLPLDYDHLHTPRALLWMRVDDIDDRKEAQMFINGQGPVALAEGWLGEGVSHEGYIELQPTMLRGGDNRIHFVFRDDLGGTTRGYEILDALLVVARRGEARPVSEWGRGGPCRMFELENLGALAVFESTLSPASVRMPRGAQLRWMPHTAQRGDGAGGWTPIDADMRYLMIATGRKIVPAGLLAMDNGQVLLLATWHNGQRSRPIITVSDDSGDTFSDWRLVKGVFGHAAMLVDGGGGNISFQNETIRVFSTDYGQTFAARTALGGAYRARGNALIETLDDGRIRVAMIAHAQGGARFLYSHDGGRNWEDAIQPDTWSWTKAQRTGGVAAGSLIRADNGTLVAALRADSPQVNVEQGDGALQGLAVSWSDDDGMSWRTPRFLHPSGRHDPHLQRLDDGRLMMHYVLAHEMNPAGHFTSFNRGVEAVVSADNGDTWDAARRYQIDRWLMFDPNEPYKTFAQQVNACRLADGRIITVYGHELSQSIVMIRWRP